MNQIEATINDKVRAIIGNLVVERIDATERLHAALADVAELKARLALLAEARDKELAERALKAAAATEC